MHDKIRLARARQMFARLYSLCEEQRTELKRDPAPFLERAHREVMEARKLREDVYAALSGFDELMRPGRIDESITSVIHRRNEKALKLLRAAASETEVRNG